MIDILNQRVEQIPQKEFIEYDDQSISYCDFNYMVNHVVTQIKKANNNERYIGVQIDNKLKLLILIIAINRSERIPILYPNYPNIQDYIKSTKIPITFQDHDIIIDDSSIVNNREAIYDPNATQLVVFTSGTTGFPKPCRLTYNNLYENALMWDKVIQFDMNDIYLNHMPITHVSGLCIFFRALYNNFKMIVKDFNAEHYVPCIKNNRINLISMVPSMLQTIIENNPQSIILQDLKAIIVGGSAINSRLLNLLKINQIPAYISYGMSETASGIAGFWNNKTNNKRYKPHDAVNISVDKSQIIIKSKTVMKGYMHAKDVNGVLNTPDIGEVYDGGLFKIKKGEDSVFNYSGENISKEYVKQHIELYPEVEKCTLKIVSDNKWGEILHAYIKFTKDIESNILLNKIKTNLPRHLVPKKIIKQ